MQTFLTIGILSFSLFTVTLYLNQRFRLWHAMIFVFFGILAVVVRL